MPVKNIADLRREYAKESLDESDVSPDPFQQFARWFGESFRAELPDPNAMVLATVGRSGRPSARTVLLKGCDERGLVFFTNYESRKGQDLLFNPQASLLFVWLELERQVRAEGRVERASEDESDEYFRSRPLDSRLGAWASPQSQTVPDRHAIEERFAEAARLHGDDPLRPPYWGGYRLIPDQFEFWQGRPSRLHDRIQYRLAKSAWIIERLAP
ncbi:MAG: pyridoxamine 5'-phosphate oxidase [Proteobacteria bacterium]|nr:MAG: pyridoxamine 5'-phosphate oxidase [Pseudomonadota bacterium]